MRPVGDSFFPSICSFETHPSFLPNSLSKFVLSSSFSKNNHAISYRDNTDNQKNFSHTEIAFDMIL